MEYKKDHQSTLLENMPDGSTYLQVVTDKHDQPIDYTSLQVSPAFTKMTGLSEKMFCGKRVTVFDNGE